MKARSPAHVALASEAIPLTWANLQAVSIRGCLAFIYFAPDFQRERRMLGDDTSFVVICPSKAELVEFTTDQQQIQTIASDSLMPLKLYQYISSAVRFEIPIYVQKNISPSGHRHQIA